MDIVKRMFPVSFGKLMLAFALTFALQIGNAQTAASTEHLDDDDDEDENKTAETVDWHAERDEILQEIKKYVDETVAKTVTRDSTTKFITTVIQRGMEIPKLGNFKNLRGVNMPQWKWPIAKPKESLETIVNAKTADIVQRVNIELPDSAKTQFPLDAQKKYEMFKPGERISIVLRQGLGTNTDVNGIFSAITAERIMIGKRYVSRRDLDADTEARFYTEQNAVKIDEYVRRENDLYDARKASRVDDLKRQEIPPAFHAGGYVPDPIKPGSSIKTAKEEFWIARNELHTKIFNTLTRQAKEKLTAIETPKRFAERGYIQAPNENDEIEWMPQTVAEKIKLEKEAAQAANPDGAPAEEMPPPY
jgi:hypothetical protein